ncbi:PAS domain S-box protein [Nitrospira sp. Nam74]
MNTMLRILHLEDNPRDAELIQMRLSEEGVACEIVLVAGRKDFVEALEGQSFDVILSDYTVPGFDGLEALTIAHQACPHIPFIFVSGTIGEESAVVTMQCGATDYVLKGRLSRLKPAIQRALREAEERAQRKQAEEARTRNQLRLQAVLDSALDAVVGMDSNGLITDWNRRAEQIFGWSESDALGKPFVTLIIPPHQGEAHLHGLRHFMRTGQETGLNRRVETTALRRDGTEFPVELAISVIEIEGAYRFNAFIADITERKQREQTIREQATLLDVAHDAIVVTDLEDSILYWNKGAEHVYGWTSAEARGKRFSTLLYEEPPPLLKEAIDKLLQKDEWRGELEQFTRAGKAITIESRWTLVRDSNGKAKSILVVNSDITERKSLEKQFLRAQRLENLGTLAGGIAHDLNNVLGPILMGVQLLSAGRAGDKQQELIDAMQLSVKRGASLVRQILSFARGAEGERSLVDIRRLMTEIETITKQTFPRGIQLQSLVRAEPWPVSGDFTQLYQVLLNLCVNARDAMPHGGRLTMKADNVTLDQQYAYMQVHAQPGPYVLLSISDTGTGMPAGVIEKIFDPFFTTKAAGLGTGLGLSTALGIVKSHGGFLDVYSEVGKGSEFRVYLPAQRSEVMGPGTDEPQEWPMGHGEVVLLVDDEAAILEMTKATLEAHEYKVFTASDGTEAVALYAEHQREIDVVITDMMMPYLNGSNTIRALQKLNPAVKILVVSGLMGNEQVAEVAGTTQVAFLQKPYTAESLLITLQQVIGPNQDDRTYP